MGLQIDFRPGAVVVRSGNERLSCRIGLRALTIGLALLVLCLMLGAVALATGTYPVSLAGVADALSGNGEEMVRTVVTEWRLPQVMLALLLGAALGMSGAIFQSLTRNPLGSPDIIGFAAVLVSMLIGVGVGLLAGFHGGRIDNLLMRLGDTVLSIPTLLMAILVSAVFRGLQPPELRDPFAAMVLVLAISLTNWVQYARVVRALTMVERRKEYVLAARIIHVPAARIMLRHILPNTLTPVLVSATLNLGLAILSEATLSFLGVGMPITQPSLGTLIRIGNQYLFSGSWWLVVFPSLQLGLIVLSVNLLGDWLRDALNPKLR